MSLVSFSRSRWASSLCLFAALFFIGCGDSAEDPNEPTDPNEPSPVELPSLGYQLLLGLDDLAEPKSGTVRLYSSHDPRDAANIDYNQYLRREEGNTFVMVDHQGPGVLTRFWMTARTGPPGSDGPGFYQNAVLRFYVDGDATPLLEISPAQFFAGNTFPFIAPLVGQHSNPGSSNFPDGKGFYSYVPLSFASSLKVTITDPLPPGAKLPVDRLFYHANILDRTGLEAVEASPVRAADGSLSLSTLDSEAHSKALAQWADPYNVALEMQEASQVVDFAGPVSGTATVADLTGPGIVRGFQLGTAGLSPAQLERAFLRLTYENESGPAMEIPLGTGWGQHFLRTPFRGLAQGALADGTLYMRLPMPFRQAFRMELISQSGSLPISARVFWDETDVPEGTRYLHATFVSQTVQNLQRLVLANVNGAGHLVGSHLVVNVRSDPHALEGDEFITIDGVTAYKGTGTEDFYNAHWFFEGGLRSHPLHGLTSQGSRIRPDVDTHRFLIPDLIPFSSNLLFELENGNVPGNSDDYRAVTFFYLGR